MSEWTPIRELLAQLSDWFFAGPGEYEPWNEAEAKLIITAWLAVHDQAKDAEIKRLKAVLCIIRSGITAAYAFPDVLVWDVAASDAAELIDSALHYEVSDG